MALIVVVAQQLAWGVGTNWLQPHVRNAGSYVLEFLRWPFSPVFLVAGVLLLWWWSWQKWGEEEPPASQPDLIPEARIVETIVEKIVEVEPPDYQWLRNVKVRQQDRGSKWITAMPSEDFHLQGFLQTRDTLKPRFLLEGYFYNDSIFFIEIERAEGHISIEGAGSLDEPTAQMTSMPSGSPNSGFQMRISFELTHQSAVSKLTELSQESETFLIRLQGLRVFFRAKDNDDAPLGRFSFPDEVTVPVRK